MLHGHVHICTHFQHCACLLRTWVLLYHSQKVNIISLSTYSSCSFYCLLTGFGSAPPKDSSYLHSLGTPLSRFERDSTSSNSEDRETVINIEETKQNLFKDSEEQNRRRSSSSSSDSPISPGGRQAVANGDVKLRDKSWKEKRRSRERPLSAFLLDSGSITQNKEEPQKDVKAKELDDLKATAFLSERKSDKPAAKEMVEETKPEQIPRNGDKTDVQAMGKKTSTDHSSVLVSGTQALAIFHRRRRTKVDTDDIPTSTSPVSEASDNISHDSISGTGPSVNHVTTPAESSSEQVTKEDRHTTEEQTPAVKDPDTEQVLVNGGRDENLGKHTGSPLGRPSPTISGRNKLLEKKMKMMALAMEGTSVDSQKIETGRVSVWIARC